MVAPIPPVNVVITDDYVFPAYFPAGSCVFVEENVITTITSVIFNQDCTFVLGRNSKVYVGTGTTVTFKNNCCLIMQPGSKLTVANGSILSLGTNCKVDFSQGIVELGPYYVSDKKATIRLGKDTLLKCGCHVPISGSGVIQAPEFNPSQNVTVQDYAVFEAPAIQIFDADIDVTGNWHMDRAYPQWFAPQDCTDWVDPIHKAITMKRTGEVFLQRGLYKIKRSIHIPYGIHLVGESGRRDFDYENYKYKDTHGTIIAATLMSEFRDENAWKYFDFGSMILININPDKIPGVINNKQPSDIRNKSDRGLWVKATPTATCTALRNLGLYNGAKIIVGNILYDNPEVVPELTGVFVAGACVFENLYFGAFKQAIVKTRDYADNMRILDCTFSKSYEFHNYPALLNATTERDEDQNSNNALYMVQLNGSGDNLIFRGNVFHGDNHYKFNDKNNTSVEFNYNYALSVDRCFGGTIDDNIINSRVLISSCRGLTFSNNHMESDAYDRYYIQLRIIDSQVTVSSNFFYKSETNNIVVRGDASGEVCAAILENNSFFCRFAEIPKSSDETELQYKARYEEYIERWKKRSSASEICINLGASVQIRNQFRQINGVNYMSWPTPVGVQFKLLDKNGNEMSSTENGLKTVNRFNTLSPYLSSQGNIKVGYKIESLLNTQVNINSINININDVKSNANVRWYAKSGYYDYYAQIVYDKDRQIVGTINGYNNAHLMSSAEERRSYFDSIIEGDVAKSKGTIIPLSISGWNATLIVYRSYRKILNSLVDHWDKVAIPVCGAETLYDNGITLSGYLWEKMEVLDNNRPEIIYNSLSGITAVTFRNSNVECLSTDKPSSSKMASWQQGDIIYNVGDDESWNVFIKK